jgi:hypothetical protein
MTLLFVTLHILAFVCWNFHVDVLGTSQLHSSTDSRQDNETSLSLRTQQTSAPPLTDFVTDLELKDNLYLTYGICNKSTCNSKHNSNAELRKYLFIKKKLLAFTK